MCCLPLLHPPRFRLHNIPSRGADNLLYSSHWIPFPTILIILSPLCLWFGVFFSTSTLLPHPCFLTSRFRSCRIPLVCVLVSLACVTATLLHFHNHHLSTIFGYSTPNFPPFLRGIVLHHLLIYRHRFLFIRNFLRFLLTRCGNGCLRCLKLDLAYESIVTFIVILHC